MERTERVGSGERESICQMEMFVLPPLSPVGCACAACGGVPAKIIEGMVATSSAPLPFFLSPIRGKWNQGDGDRLPFCKQGFVEGREAARPRHRKIICRRSGEAVPLSIAVC